VQGEFGRFDPARCALIEKLPREVQSGGGRGDGASLAREHSLIALGVEAIFFVSFDVWRQWGPAYAVDDLVKVAVDFEANHSAARLPPVEHFGRKLSTRELDSRAREQRSSRTHQRFPNEWLDSADQKDLDASAGDRLASRSHAKPAPDQPRGKNASVIQNKQIA
jgi:hypothetical protein